MNRSRFHTRAARCALPLLLASAAAFAAPTLEDYAAPASVEMMSLSPDGRRVAFRTHQAEQDAVLIYSLDDRKVLSGIDVATIRPTRLYFLDHTHLILAASADNFMPGSPGYRRMSSAFSLDIESRALHQLLTAGVGIIGGQSGLGDILGASADGKRVFMPAFTQRRPFADAEFSLMEVDLAAIERPRVLERGSPTTIDYLVDGNGTVLVEERFNDETDEHRILAYHDGKPKTIYRLETEIREIGVVALTADRTSLIFEDNDDERVGYYTMSLADGTVSAPIFKRADADVEAILTDINRVAYGVVYSGLTPSYEFFDERLTARMQEIQAKFPGNSVWLADASPDLRHLVITVEGSSAAGAYYLYSDDKVLRYLSSSRPGIGAEFVNPVAAFDYEARDGATIPALLTLPRAHKEDPRKLPAVMLPHGGPESHDWLEFDWFAQALASQGYAVIQPQFRGSSGFGVQHLLAGRGEWGKKSQNDITDALQHLVAEGVVDPERVCIAGMSYGGFAALAGGAFTPELYRCIVSVSGVSDVRRMLSEEKLNYGRDHWAVAYWNKVIARGDDSKETLDSVSPANFAASFTAPVLLVHGDKDNIVDYDQSLHMERQLRRAHKQVQLIKLEGEDHYLSNPATRLQCLRAVVDFINQSIGERT